MVVICYFQLAISIFDNYYTEEAEFIFDPIFVDGLENTHTEIENFGRKLNEFKTEIKSCIESDVHKLLFFMLLQQFRTENMRVKN